MKKIIALASLALATAVLSGCETTEEQPPQPQPTATHTGNPEGRPCPTDGNPCP